MKGRKISLAITTMNRFEFTIKCFEQVMDDERIDDIVIVDDCSTDDSFFKLKKYFEVYPKIRIYKNENNLGVYKNKHRAISMTANEWVIIFDSDNVIWKDYIDKLYQFPEWKENISYCPDFGLPKLDYTHFAGTMITKNNAGNCIDQKNGGSLFNTLNYFCNRNYFMTVFDENAEPIAADSIYINYLYLINNGAMYIVPGLRYIHTIHDGSHYVNNCKRSDEQHKKITDLIRNMK